MSRGLVVDGQKLRHLRAAVAELSPRTTRFNDGHADAERHHLLGDRLHKAFDPPLRRVIHGVACKGDLPAIGRNLDDTPAALSAQVWQRGADELDRSEQVGRNNVLDLLVRKLFRCSEQTVARVADQHVDASMLSKRAL